MDIQSSTASQAATQSSEASERSKLDRDAFMKLLVTQLQNQDPMEPMDTREMITQLSQLTSVEHLMGMERQLGSLQNGIASLVNGQASTLVGKDVVASAATLHLDASGPVQSTYTLPARAKEVSITIRNAEGRALRTLRLGEQGAGAQRLLWDGNDDQGSRVAAGSYRFEVNALDEQNQPLSVSTRISGRVRSVSYEQGVAQLEIGTSRVRLSEILSVESSTPSATNQGEAP